MSFFTQPRLMNQDISNDIHSATRFNKVDEILPTVFITNFKTSSEPEILANFKGSLNICDQDKPDAIKEFMKTHGIKYLWLNLQDYPHAPLLPLLDTAYDFISEVVQNGKVLVNCHMGISRSASAILYYKIIATMLDLNKIKKLSSEDYAKQLVEAGLKEMQTKRPVEPNPGFIKQIISSVKFEINQYKENKKTIIDLNSFKHQLMSNNCDTFIDGSGQPGAVICLTNDDFDTQGNLKNFGSVDGVVFYGAPWCGHCVRMKPEYANFSNMIKGSDRQAFFVNADKNKELLARINPRVWGYSINGFPTVVSYHKGKFYSEYGPSDMASFRTAKDLKEFSDGIGRAQVEEI
jgi:thiol-disulfide isomerase/thioredoxin